MCFNSHTNTLINPHNYRGMSAAAAELMYIKLAQQLAEYGHEKLQEMVSNGCSVVRHCTYMYMYMHVYPRVDVHVHVHAPHVHVHDMCIHGNPGCSIV